MDYLKKLTEPKAASDNDEFGGIDMTYRSGSNGYQPVETTIIEDDVKNDFQKPQSPTLEYDKPKSEETVVENTTFQPKVVNGDKNEVNNDASNDAPESGSVLDESVANKPEEKHSLNEYDYSVTENIVDSIISAESKDETRKEPLITQSKADAADLSESPENDADPYSVTSIAEEYLNVKESSPEADNNNPNAIVSDELESSYVLDELIDGAKDETALKERTFEETSDFDNVVSKIKRDSLTHSETTYMHESEEIVESSATVLETLEKVALDSIGETSIMYESDDLHELAESELEPVAESVELDVKDFPVENSEPVEPVSVQEKSSEVPTTSSQVEQPDLLLEKAEPKSSGYDYDAVVNGNSVEEKTSVLPDETTAAKTLDEVDVHPVIQQEVNETVEDEVTERNTKVDEVEQTTRELIVEQEKQTESITPVNIDGTESYGPSLTEETYTSPSNLNKDTQPETPEIAEVITAADKIDVQDTDEPQKPEEEAEAPASDTIITQQSSYVEEMKSNDEEKKEEAKIVEKDLVSADTKPESEPENSEATANEVKEDESPVVAVAAEPETIVTNSSSDKVEVVEESKIIEQEPATQSYTSEYLETSEDTKTVEETPITSELEIEAKEVDVIQEAKEVDVIQEAVSIESAEIRVDEIKSEDQEKSYTAETTPAETAENSETDTKDASVAETLVEESYSNLQENSGLNDVVEEDDVEEQSISQADLMSMNYYAPTPPPTPMTPSIERSRGYPSYARSSSVSSTSSRGFRASFIAVASPPPMLRTSAGGAPLPLSAIAAPVRHVNPLLDEILYSIELMQNNDPSLEYLDLKDSTILTAQHGSALAAALANNDYIKSINLSNVRLGTQTAIEFAEALKLNSSLQNLILDQNLIGPAGIKALAESLRYNETLLELRVAQQRQQFGTEAEQTLAETMKKNETLIRFGGQIRDAASRNFIDRAITRNKEIARKKRLAEAENN